MGNYAKFQAEINEICEKFIHSLNIISSVKVGAAKEAFPDDFALPEKVLLKFVLVIKNHKPEWCRGVKTKLIESLPQYLKKIWEPAAYVINQDTAAKRNLIIR